MIDTKKMFARLDFQAITEFILSGEEITKFDDGSYNDRLEKSKKAIIDRLKGVYPNENDFGRAYDELVEALAVHQSVFTELGMQFGAKLTYQLLLIDPEGGNQA